MKESIPMSDHDDKYNNQPDYDKHTYTPGEDGALIDETGLIILPGGLAIREVEATAGAGWSHTIEEKVESTLRALWDAHPRKLTRKELRDITSLSLSQLFSAWKYIRSMDPNEIGGLPVMILDEHAQSRGGTYVYGFDTVQNGNWYTAWQARHAFSLLRSASDTLTQMRARLEDDLDAEYRETERNVERTLDRMESFIHICGARWGASEETIDSWLRRRGTRSA
jgi:hypothetical protein